MTSVIDVVLAAGVIVLSTGLAGTTWLSLHRTGNRRLIWVTAAFAAFAHAQIRVAKLQLSSALRVPNVDETTERSLAAFDDGVYLHQVVQQRNGRIARYVDLAPAFAALRSGDAGGEWRIHCHVPIFLEKAGAFHSTQQTLKAALECVQHGFVAPHLEVETYTWDVLPAELRVGSRAAAIAREMQWVLEELA